MKIACSFSAALALLASAAHAHTYISNVIIEGERKEEGQCIRPYPPNRNYPVKDVSSTDLTCGVNGIATTAEKTCPVEAGSTITVEWHHDSSSDPSDIIIDETHLGPCSAWLAPLESNGKGDVWFKIYEDGYDSATNTWCVNKLIANGGKLDIPLPADIKPGDYLLRGEIIALHEADTDYAANQDRGAQYYINCAQISVSGSGTAEPKGYAIPGIYTHDEPGIVFNLYSSYASYPIPGPGLYISDGSGDDGADGESSVADESTSEEYSVDESTSEEPAPEESSEEYSVDEPASEESSEEKPAHEETSEEYSVDESTSEEPAPEESSEESSVDETAPEEPSEEEPTPEESSEEYSVDEPAPEESSEEPTPEESSEEETPDATTEEPTEEPTEAPTEEPTSSAPVVTVTTTITAAPGKCPF